jgi:hypothetical protein
VQQQVSAHPISPPSFGASNLAQDPQIRDDDEDADILRGSSPDTHLDLQQRGSELSLQIASPCAVLAPKRGVSLIQSHPSLPYNDP